MTIKPQDLFKIEIAPGEFPDLKSVWASFAEHNITVYMRTPAHANARFDVYVVKGYDADIENWASEHQGDFAAADLAMGPLPCPEQ